MITIKLPIYISDKDSKIIQDIQNQQSLVIKASYSMMTRKNLKQKDIRSEFKKYNLGNFMDAWLIQSGIYKGLELFENDKSKKIKVKRIFGGKDNLKKYIHGKITKQEYKDNKLFKIISIGEALKKGNRKFTFLPNKIIFKPNRNTKIDINLPSLRKNYNDVYKKLVAASNNKKLPITISLDQNFIYITYNEKHLQSINKNKIISNRCASIDMNPRYIGLTICDYDNHKQNIVFTKLYSLSNLLGKHKSSNKISHETIEIAHDIGRICNHYGVEYFFKENLSFKNTNLKIKNVNRDINNQWKRNLLIDVIMKYYNVISINSAYTSTIGNIRNTNYPDPIAASLEISRRGYCWIKKLNKFYPDLISKGDLEEQWKQTDLPDFKSWIEIHEYLKKNPKLKYRNPLPSEESFRKFNSYKSYCFYRTY